MTLSILLVLLFAACQNPAGVYAPLSSANSQALQFLVQGNQTFANTTAQFTQFETAVSGFTPPNSTVSAQMNATEVSLATAQTSMNGVLNAASCASISNPYNNLLITLCGSKGIGAMASLWVTASVACAFIFLMAVCSTAICLQHPGDDAAKEMVEAHERKKAGLPPSEAGKPYANQSPAQGGWGSAPQGQGVQMVGANSGNPSAYV
jgi:hypothetical protein